MKSRLLAFALFASAIGAACSSGSPSSPALSGPGTDASSGNDATTGGSSSGASSSGGGDDAGAPGLDGGDGATDGGGSPLMDPPWDASSWNEEAGVADGGDTWASWVQGFVEVYCVHCHNSKDPTGRDFNFLDIVKTNASTIRCGIFPADGGTRDSAWSCPPGFPPPAQFPLPTSTPQPTDDERFRIIAWIDAGCP